MFGRVGKSAITAWADAIKSNTAITSLNLANNDMNGEDTNILGPAISGNGALSCEDGGDYHEWSLNPNYHEAGSFLCPKGHILLELQTPKLGFNCDGGEGCLDQGSHYPVGTSLFGCRICNFDFCSQCVATAKTVPEYKYISTAPDVEGQDEDPGVSLGNDMCLHCHKPKDQHSDKRTMTSLDVSNNRLYAKGTKLLAEALKGNQIMTDLNLSSNGMTAGGMSGVVALADAIPDMGALSILNMSKNGMRGSEAGKAFGDALATNTALREIDLSGDPERSELELYGHNMDAAFVKALAPGLSDNEALAKLDMSSNNLGALVLPEGWTEDCDSDDDEVYMHTDGREQGYNPGKPASLIAIANAIPKMGALTSLNLAKNNLGRLVLPVGWTEEWMHEKFEGYGYKHIDGREQKENPSQPECIVVLASAIKDMRALSSLNLSKNHLANKEAGKALSQALVGNSMLKELDLSSNYDGHPSHAIEFAQELAVGIKDNRALAKLDMSSNNIGAEEEDNLQRICMAGGIELAEDSAQRLISGTIAAAAKKRGGQ
jgi:Leucine-rich repeat (LRR) protein